MSLKKMNMRSMGTEETISGIIHPNIMVGEFHHLLELERNFGEMSDELNKDGNFHYLLIKD